MWLPELVRFRLRRCKFGAVVLVHRLVLDAYLNAAAQDSVQGLEDLSPLSWPPTPRTGSCRDSSGGATDSAGYSCADGYAGLLRYCGSYDDSDFTSIEMCCECRGVLAARHPVPAPTGPFQTRARRMSAPAPTPMLAPTPEAYLQTSSQFCPFGYGFIKSETLCNNARQEFAGMGFNGQTFSDSSTRRPWCWVGTAGKTNFNPNGDDDFGANWAASTMLCEPEETGNAWADTLFGDRAPSGRLPITIPASEEDSIPPGGSSIVSYSEGLETGYRNNEFKAAYPFRHGLSYSNFTYLPPTTSPCAKADAGVHAGWGRDAAATRAICVRTAVINDGKVASRTVAQLYVELPPVAGHPAPLLKGFWKTGVIEPGGLENVTFPLFRHDLSYYDGRAGRWIKCDSAVVHVGESSSDIRHSVPIVVRIGLLDFIFLAVLPPSGSMLPPGLAGRCFAIVVLACLLVSSYRLVQLVAFCHNSTSYTYLTGVDQCKGCEEDARMMAVEASSQSQLETAMEDSLNSSFYDGEMLDRYLEHSQRHRKRMQQMQLRQSEKSRRQEQAHLELVAQRREDMQWKLQEQRAVTNVRRAIGYLRPATPRNLGQLQDELKLALQQNIEECGARRELVLEEACQALAQARARCGLEGLPADFSKFKPPQQA